MFESDETFESEQREKYLAVRVRPPLAIVGVRT